MVAIAKIRGVKAGGPKTIQNGLKIVCSSYGSAYLLNGSIRLRVMVQTYMNRYITIYKKANSWFRPI